MVHPPAPTNQPVNEAAVAVQPPSQTDQPMMTDAEIQTPSPPHQAVNKADAETQADLTNELSNFLPNDSIADPISLADSPKSMLNILMLK
jgi:hypothetical protein